jgi:hypothetical protein
MRKLAQLALIFFLSLLALSLSILPGQAAPANTVTTTVQIYIDDPATYWTYPYITREGVIVKPASVQVEWDAGDGKSTKTTLVTQGQKSGVLVITSEKGALLTLKVVVCDANNAPLGTLSMQTRNKGQTESFTVTYPDFTEPKINQGAPAPSGARKSY